MPVAPDPSPRRMAVCALLVLVFAVGVWGFIQWRTAPPPPPQMVMPDLPPH